MLNEAAKAATKAKGLMGIKDIFIQLYTRFVDYMPKLIAAIIVLTVFLLAARLFEKIAKKAMQRLEWEPAVEQLMVSAIRATIIGFGVITAAGQLGVNITSVLAGLTVTGFALSFAFKDILENLMSGIMILTDRPFCVNDALEVDGAAGKVIEITLRSTRLVTADEKIVIIPNSTMIKSKITNNTMIKRAAELLTCESGLTMEESKEKTPENAQ